MPGRHSLTIQLNPYGVGHAAVTLTDPSGQTYAGFGPRVHNAPISPGQFDVHSVPPGTTSLPSDYSNVFGGDHRTFTVPITEEQARAGHAEIDRIAREGRWYNSLRLDPRVCTTIVDRIMRAAGVDAGLYILPRIDDEYLSDIADTLARDPKARVMRQHRLPIPDALRGIQRDYAFIGGGHDTPSERVRRPSSGEGFDDAAPFATRFGDWAASPAGSTPAPGALKETIDDAPDSVRRSDIRRLTRQTIPTATDAFASGASPVPYLLPSDVGDRSGQWGVRSNDWRVQASRPVGVFAGEQSHSVPPPVWGTEDQTKAGQHDDAAWFARWLQPFILPR